MDPTKKRKLDENGVASADTDSPCILNPQDSRKIVERLTNDQLLDILSNAVTRHPDVLEAVRSIADADPTQRKLFIRGLGWDTTTEGLRNIFSVYGELEEAVVILDKATGKSKGYGFITFKHIDGAMLALKEPSKKIDGRVTVTNLAVAGNSANSTNNPVDVSLRKIFVGNVPNDMSADKLLAHFACYGEIEEGPLGFDKQTGKPKGFALFVYKTAEGAQAALVDPIKTVEGKQLNCRLADNKKAKGPDGIPPGGPGNVNVNHGDGMGMVPPPAGGSMPGSYGGPGGHGSYGPFSGAPPLGHHVNSSLGGPGQVPSSLGGVGAAGYGAGLGGPYGGYGGPGSAGYGGLGGAAGSGGLGGGSSLYRLPPSSVGMPSGGYSEGGHYNLSSTSSAYPSQHHQATGTSPVPRVPPMYPNVPPYY
ncbi:UBP1-associated protein 2C-like [Mangifera indica]|uniref:UBP1-associated protein 2C-like n=1 Tax=Mangifera indica TaxID=29780 RepID=UPI001CFA78F3|nr:UBP1-associated protein 2C-like [Mangifera indica]XP_044473485.1 UBP1-associated protein 2C-like [Mangifera indica]XP_044473486.1 UBP1-associated protein 2C-like [Mangifera indica]